MRLLIIAAVCAFIVVNGMSHHIVKKDLGDDGTLDVVLIKRNDKRFCAGVMIIDLTILSAAVCVPNFQPGKSNLTVVFKNNDQSYTIKDIDLDGEIAILMLDEKENPPKMKSKIEWPSSDIYPPEGVVEVIHTYKKVDILKRVNVKTFDEAECQSYSTYGNKFICAVPAKNKNPLSITDIGSPMLYNGVLEAVLLTADENVSYPNLFDRIYNRKEFIEKHLSNNDNNEKEDELPTYTDQRNRGRETGYLENQQETEAYTDEEVKHNSIVFIIE